MGNPQVTADSAALPGQLRGSVRGPSQSGPAAPLRGGWPSRDRGEGPLWAISAISTPNKPLKDARPDVFRKDEMGMAQKMGYRTYQTCQAKMFHQHSTSCSWGFFGLSEDHTGPHPASQMGKAVEKGACTSGG